MRECAKVRSHAVTLLGCIISLVTSTASVTCLAVGP